MNYLFEMSIIIKHYVNIVHNFIVLECTIRRKKVSALTLLSNVSTKYKKVFKKAKNFQDIKTDGGQKIGIWVCFFIEVCHGHFLL